MVNLLLLNDGFFIIRPLYGSRNEWDVLKDMTMEEAKRKFVKLWFLKYREFVDRELFRPSSVDNQLSSLYIKK
jgi:hypothetical protein